MQSSVALIAALAVFAAAIPLRAEATKLQWSKGRTPARKQADTLQFVKPSIVSNKRTDTAIQLADYDGDAPRLTSGRGSESQTRSLVVNRSDESPDDFRSAQLPQTNAGAGSTSDPAGSSNPKIEDGLRTPFADTPQEPAKLTTPPLPETNTTPPVPETEKTLPPPDNSNLLQFNRQPQQQPPAAGGQPSSNVPSKLPDTGQFQPILPSGPGPDQSPPTPPSTNEATIKAEGVKAKQSCEKSLENLRAYTVDKVKLTIAVTGTEGEDFPFECAIDDGTTFSGRCWEQTTYMWKASALCHKPLYFEDEQLERYGHSFSPCFQPFVSGAHFFTRLPVLPYCMGVEPPCECIYALGHYRPGNCAPYMCNPVPLSLRGAAIEAGVVTGAAAIFP